ncbi:hypothetical protein RugamoR64_28070 [Duganella rhizosphaerae]|uniref:sensor histidine kinase n=1 Tax=Duganella rhizosphaerae TaxID=2885763 RepID=UPI0030E8D08B
MQQQFFPRAPEFWFFHAGAMLLTAGLTLASALLWDQLSGNVLWSSLAWMPPYTLAVLAFRWWYLRRCGGRRAPPAMRRLVPAVVLYATVAGVLVMLAVTAVMAPFYWTQMYVPQLRSGLLLSPFQFVWRSALSGGFQTQLLIGAWIFVYVGATRNQAASVAELLNERLQGTLKEAQLSSLASQLNPHFLFNALNNIRFMIHEDAGRADSTLVALSDLLRYSLESARCDTVPLQQEIAMVERYVAVVEIQLERRLAFALRLPPGLRAWRVPPMLLQMLVENAVKHGIEPARRGGRLTVTLAEQGQLLNCRIVNDVDPAAEHAGAAAGIGIGLQNIERRLQLLYGGAAGVALRRSATEFDVTVSLPWECAQ